MDLLAALALIMVIEGLALFVFAKSLPELLVEIQRLGPRRLRILGLVSLALGAATYIMIRNAQSVG